MRICLFFFFTSFRTTSNLNTINRDHEKIVSNLPGKFDCKVTKGEERLNLREHIPNPSGKRLTISFRLS